MNILLWWQLVHAGTLCVDPENNNKKIIAELFPVLGHKEHLHIYGRVFRDEQKRAKELKPIDDMSVSELKQGEVSFYTHSGIELGTSTIDKEGFVSTFLKLPEEQKEESFMIEARWNSCVIGRTTMRVLPYEYEDMVLRSDVDMTYLHSNFHSIAGMWRLLHTPAKERDVIQGMPDVYRLFRDQHNANRPLVFISGSPMFFKRVLEEKMYLDRVLHDGFVLKPMKEMVAQKKRIPVYLLKEQIGYKLEALLRLRQALPPNAKEFLMGDDTEADLVVYSIYTRLLEGDLSERALKNLLIELKVNKGWQEKIFQLLPDFEASLGEKSKIVGIAIHKTSHPSYKFGRTRWMIPQRTVFHSGGAELLQQMYARGWLSKP